MLARELLGTDSLDLDFEICGIAYDSRKIKPGDLFVAIAGAEQDGHRFIDDAVDRGAVAVITEQDVSCRVPYVKVPDTKKALAELAAKFYGMPARKLKLIGVTGTNGKTTVTYLIKSILEAAGEHVCLIGTNEVLMGDAVFSGEKNTPTTPNALELQQIFAHAHTLGITYVVMEVSSHALALDRVHGCQFEVGVFTNLTQDHLDFHGTMEQYLAEKKKLFSMSRCGVINIDDIGGRTIAASVPCKVLTVGLHDADILANRVRLLERGVEFQADGMRRSIPVELQIPGKFSVYNALCAIGACVALDISDTAICQGLKAVSGVRGRVELVPVDADFSVIIDYAHSPDGLEKILHTVRGFARGRVITLFGCGGDRDKTKRPIMGKISGKLSDFTVITSDNPRTEDPMEIIEDIVSGIEKTTGKYLVIQDRREAICRALSLAQKDDVVILAGKGQETYQMIGTEKIDFDERKIVKEILAESKAW